MQKAWRSSLHEVVRKAGLTFCDLSWMDSQQQSCRVCGPSHHARDHGSVGGVSAFCLLRDLESQRQTPLMLVLPVVAISLVIRGVDCFLTLPLAAISHTSLTHTPLSQLGTISQKKKFLLGVLYKDINMCPPLSRQRHSSGEISNEHRELNRSSTCDSTTKTDNKLLLQLP